MTRETGSDGGCGMQHVRSVERAFAVLEHMADSGGSVTVSQLSKSLGVSMAGTYRMLRTMVTLGYGRQLSDRSYTLGARLIRLGEGAIGQHMSAARPALASAVLQLGETATLAMLDGDTIVYTLQVQSPHALRSNVEIRTPAPAHETGAGRVLLAQLTDDQLRQSLARARSPNPRTSDGAYNQRIDSTIRQIRAAGYSIDEGDHELGMRCYTVPIPGAGRPFVISVAGPIERLGNGSEGRAITVLRETAEKISEGFKPAPSPKAIRPQPRGPGVPGRCPVEQP
ncbi:IclR family transcriptional regulator [Arthrobacter sp. AZCC_0090]|uniref:IclR family transcriptional regulator n=1 Tax=Arthrobacter sp. AZCC_0090 TaxID=2735881 RepID=UPI0037BE8664